MALADLPHRLNRHRPRRLHLILIVQQIVIAHDPNDGLHLYRSPFTNPTYAHRRQRGRDITPLLPQAFDDATFNAQVNDPCAVLFKDGQVIANKTGGGPRPALQSWINEALS